MTKLWTDSFDRANGALGSTENLATARGTRYSVTPWEILSGTFSISGNNGTSTAAAGALAIAVVDTGKRSNGSCDMYSLAAVNNFYGAAAYARVLDVNNWFRARIAAIQTSYQYYITEYQHETGTQMYSYSTYYNEKEAQNFVTEKEVRYPSSCSTGAWSAWVVQSTTGCQQNPPGLPANSYGTTPACGTTEVKQWQYVNMGRGSCGIATNVTWQVQYRTRSEQTNYSLKWAPSNYTLGTAETFTGNTRNVDSGAPYWVAQSTAASSGVRFTGNTRSTLQGSLGNGASSGGVPASSTDYTYTAYPAGNYIMYNGNYYWTTSSTPSGSLDRYTGVTRQAGPYTGYSEAYYTYLEKMVAGTITTLSTISRAYSVTSVGLRAYGETIEMTINDSVINTVTDATFRYTGRKAGIGGGGSYGAIAPSFGSFTAGAINTSEKVRLSNGTWGVMNRAIRSGGVWLDHDTVRK